MKPVGTNETIPMTRRYPNLRKKVLERDSKIASKIIKAWDIDHDHEKALGIFLKEKDNLSPERYWELMRSVWIICGSNKTAPIFRKLMQSNKRSQFYFSSPEEVVELKKLPDEIKVYRAVSEKDDNGLSWTISKEYVEKYAKTFNKPIILEKTVSKDEVFAFINRNNEYEIILL